MTRLLLIGTVILLSACGAVAAPPSGAKAEVTIANYHFVPATLRISAGTTVTWSNKDDDPHTVMDTAGAFRSGALDQGQSFTFTFAKAATYRIACSMHPQMSQTIVVQ